MVRLQKYQHRSYRRADPQVWVPFHGRRRNPLKASALDAKLKKLKQLGLNSNIADEIRNDFSGLHNHPSHALYIIDWWMARLSLERLLNAGGEDVDRYLTNITRYANKYKVDAYDIALDDVLQIDHYNDLRHFAHLAANNPYFRASWPHLHQVVIMTPQRWDSIKRSYVNQETVIGEVREWNSQTSEGKPAIKLVTGKDRAVSQSIQSRIDKEKIVDTQEKSDPATLIAFLRDCEKNVRTNRYFVPWHNDVLLDFPDGKQWVVIREDDVTAEGDSLHDCARAENRKTILISLREPVTETHVQALLKAEIAFPSLSEEPSLEEIKDNAGIIVQLRGYSNSKPTPELIPYIVPLLYQKWIVHTVSPDYTPGNNFSLKDLDVETITKLKTKKPYLFSAKRFNQTYGINNYPANIKEKLIELIEFPVSKLIETIRAKRVDSVMRKRALELAKRRLRGGTKNKRGRIFAALRELLANSRDKSVLSAVFECLNGYKHRYRFFLEFFQLRKDWLMLERNHKFFADLLLTMLPSSYEGYRNRRELPPLVLKILQEAAVEHFDTLLKLIYDIPFSDKKGKNYQKLVETVLQVVVDHPHKLDSDLCRWYMEESIGWGRTNHRNFSNTVILSPKIKKQLRELINLSISRHDECYMDLAVTLMVSMSETDRAKLQPLVQLMLKHIFDQKPRHYRAREVYEQLGRLIL